MRLLFLGSGEFGLPTLERLHARHQVVGVITQPDKPAGRHRQLTPTPIGAWATPAGLTVLKAEDANAPAFVEQVKSLAADAAVVIAFGQKLSPALIDACGRLAVNLHASLLPRHRGAAPINWAILRGDHETGLSVIALAQRMDAGLIYGQARTPIDPVETAGELHDRLATLGPELIDLVLNDFANHSLHGETQDESQATKAPKLSKTDGTVDFDADADAVANRIRGLTPWPGVRVLWKTKHESDTAPGRELLLRRAAAQPDLSCFIGLQGKPAPGTIFDGHRVTVRDGAVKLLELQLPGGKPMSAEDFARGHRLAPGDRLVPIRPTAVPS